MSSNPHWASGEPPFPRSPAYPKKKKKKKEEEVVVAHRLPHHHHYYSPLLWWWRREEEGGERYLYRTAVDSLAFDLLAPTWMTPKKKKKEKRKAEEEEGEGERLRCETAGVVVVVVVAGVFDAAPTIRTSTLKKKPHPRLVVHLLLLHSFWYSWW